MKPAVRTCPVRNHTRRLPAKPSILENDTSRDLFAHVKAKGYKFRRKARRVKAVR